MSKGCGAFARSAVSNRAEERLRSAAKLRRRAPRAGKLKPCPALWRIWPLKALSRSAEFLSRVRSERMQQDK
jgi:hypothetical protein